MFRAILPNSPLIFAGNTKLENLSKYNAGHDNESGDIDATPVLYIAKYNRLIDTGFITIRDGDKNKVPNNTSPLPRRVEHR